MSRIKAKTSPHPPVIAEDDDDVVNDENHLSNVSQQYDIGDKGFLTQAERAAREMDVKDEGRLPNEQVIALIEQIEQLKHANTQLRHWLVGLVLLVVVMGLSQIATAIAAARLAKDTTVNESTGLLTVKGHDDTAVVVVATGRAPVIINMDDDGSFCISSNAMVNLFSDTITGSLTNGIVRTRGDDEEEVQTRAVAWSASGTHYNSTRACINTAEGEQYCFDYEPCLLTGGANRYLTTGNEQEQESFDDKFDRTHFHRTLTQRLIAEGDHIETPVDNVGVGGGVGTAPPGAGVGGGGNFGQKGGKVP